MVAKEKAASESRTLGCVSSLSAESMLDYLKLMKEIDSSVKLCSSKSDRANELQRFLTQHGDIFDPRA